MKASVQWQEWGLEAFQRAEREKKPVLLHIGAVWCHWCHVMDHTTYEDQRVVSLVNERFVPVRVDNDRRPDVNRRYNTGGWPTTAFLTPSGRVLTGATYVPPKEMADLCGKVLDFWEEKGDQVNVDLFKGKVDEGERDEGALGPALLDSLAEAVAQSYDPKYGGFGRAPKFPQVAALELSLDRYLTTGDDRWRTIVETTLDGMAGGGMHDPVEGGFFRYSTTRDWSVPHFEKMLEDNARLLDLYLRAGVALGRDAVDSAAHLETAGDVLRFWGDVLQNPGTPYLAGSQDADEEYYALPLEERRKRTAPYIDRTVYADWNAMAARALLRAGRVLGEPRCTRQAQELLHALDRDLRARDGGMAHFRVWRDGAFQGGPELPGLLSDQVEMADALLALYAETREPWAVQRALELVEYMEEHLAAREGGYFDGPADPKALGALKYRVRPMEENARAARVLLQLYQLTGRAVFEERARKALATQTEGLERHGSLAAVFGLALESLLRPLHVVLVGPFQDGAVGAARDGAVADGAAAGAMEALRQAVRSFPLSAVTLAVQDTAGPNPHNPEVTYPAGPQPVAYVCAGNACFAPVDTPEKLADLLSRAAQGERPSN